MDSYKGVKLIDGRTPEMIDGIINNYHYIESMKDLAKMVGIENWRKLSGILRSLYYNNFLVKKSSTNCIEEIVFKSETIIISKSKKENSFANYDGTGKNEARELILNCIASSSTIHTNILTLPAEQWIMEKMILDKNPKHKFTAVERDSETYERMLINLVNNETLRKSVPSIQNSTIGEVIKNVVSDTYTHAILDYCGTIDTAIKDVEIIMEKNLIRKNGYITITVVQNNRTKNRQSCINNYTNKFLECCNSDADHIDINNYAIYDLIMHSIGYKLIKKFTYKDTHNPMMLYIIQRIK